MNESCVQLVVHVIDRTLIYPGINLSTLLDEVPVPAPLLDEALAFGAEAVLAPVVSSRKLLSEEA